VAPVNQWNLVLPQCYCTATLVALVFLMALWRWHIKIWSALEDAIGTISTRFAKSEAAKI